MTCSFPGCRRASAASSGGALYAYCDQHVRSIVREAFAPPAPYIPEWRRRQMAALALRGRLAEKELAR